MPPAAKVRKSTSSSKSSECASSAAATTAKTEKAPSWLSVSMDAALGFRANVFQVNRLATGKKSSNATSADRSSCISIHPGASTVVCKHTLEVLISLAKSFPGHFLPWKGLEASSKESDKSTGKDYKLTSSTPTSANKGENKKSGSSNSASAENNSGSIPEFWETLLKLDMQSTSKKGKSVARSHSSVINLKSGEDEDANGSFNFESSPFGNLLAMLASPVIRRSSVLTDKLLRLLSLISVAEDQMKKTADNDTSAESASKAASQKRSLIAADHLRLAVEVLTSKSCSEQGLEDVNALLLNLSHGHEPTRDTILKLLLQGARELGSVVRQNVIDLQLELQTLKKQIPDNAAAPSDDQETAAEKDKDAASGGKKQKASGAILDRFTNQEVVLNAPSKVKGGSELQLPTMNALTNKTSSQAFFLRVLKVIIELRESALISMKKKKLVRAAAKEAKEQQKKAEGKTDDAERTEGEQMEVDKKDPADAALGGEKADDQEKDKEEEEDSLASLSEELSLEELWDALSSCLRELADTPDHHAVLVLQATVEAFFLVHAAATQPDDGKKKVCFLNIIGLFHHILPDLFWLCYNQSNQNFVIFFVIGFCCVRFMGSPSNQCGKSRRGSPHTAAWWRRQFKKLAAIHDLIFGWFSLYSLTRWPVLR